MTLPARALTALADGCSTAGESAVHALREAGRILGETLYERLAADGPPEEMPPQAFWAAVNARLDEMGLGSVSYQLLPDGLAGLSGEDLAEAGPRAPRAGGGRITAGCHLTTGLIHGLLSRVAGEPVAVLETACRAGPSPVCTFLIGSPGRLRAEHRVLSTGGRTADVPEES